MIDNDLGRGYFTIISTSFFRPRPIRVPTTDRTQKSPFILSSLPIPYSLSLPSPFSIFPFLKINHTLSPISPTSQKQRNFNTNHNISISNPKLQYYKIYLIILLNLPLIKLNYPASEPIQKAIL